MKTLKYNSILRIGKFKDEGKDLVTISFVTPDHQEHELVVESYLFATQTDFEPIPIEYRVHPACCEHPQGCPEETNTQKLLNGFNKPNSFITLTERLIEDGQSRNGGWSKKQLKLLGTSFEQKGWKKLLVGTPILKTRYAKFLELKDKHLK